MTDAVRNTAQIIFLIFLVTSCVTGTVSHPPGWVLDQPAPRNGLLYFTGTGSDAAGDPVEARRRAAGLIISAINRQLGLETDLNGSPPDTELELFYRRLNQVLNSEPGDGSDGFRLLDVYDEVRPGGAVEVSLLVEVEEEALVREGERFTLLLNRFGQLVKEQELLGDQHASEDRQYAAMTAYLNASVTAGYLPEPARRTVLPGLLHKTADALKGIRIQPMSAVMEGVSGRAFPGPFEARVIEAQTGRPVPEAALLAGYELVDVNNKMVRQEIPLYTDGNGVVRFTPQAPRIVGNGSISMFLDIRSALSSIGKDLDPDALELFKMLETTASKTRAVFPYRVVSAARHMPMGVLIIDRDSSGNETGQGYTGEGILDVLNLDGFEVMVLEQESAFLKGTPMEIALQTSDLYPSQFQRLLFGDARITEFSEKEGKYFVTVTGSLQVVEIPTGKILLIEDSLEKSVLGNNSQSTISSAYRQLGKMMGAEVVRRLP